MNLLLILSGQETEWFYSRAGGAQPENDRTKTEIKMIKNDFRRANVLFCCCTKLRNFQTPA